MAITATFVFGLLTALLLGTGDSQENKGSHEPLPHNGPPTQQVVVSSAKSASPRLERSAGTGDEGQHEAIFGFGFFNSDPGEPNQRALGPFWSKGATDNATVGRNQTLSQVKRKISVNVSISSNVTGVHKLEGKSPLSKAANPAQHRSKQNVSTQQSQRAARWIYEIPRATKSTGKWSSTTENAATNSTTLEEKGTTLRQEDSYSGKSATKSTNQTSSSTPPLKAYQNGEPKKNAHSASNSVKVASEKKITSTETLRLQTAFQETAGKYPVTKVGKKRQENVTVKGPLNVKTSTTNGVAKAIKSPRLPTAPASEMAVRSSSKKTKLSESFQTRTGDSASREEQKRQGYTKKAAGRHTAQMSDQNAARASPSRLPAGGRPSSSARRLPVLPGQAVGRTEKAMQRYIVQNRSKQYNFETLYEKRYALNQSPQARYTRSLLASSSEQSTPEPNTVTPLNSRETATRQQNEAMRTKSASRARVPAEQFTRVPLRTPQNINRIEALRNLGKGSASMLTNSPRAISEIEMPHSTGRVTTFDSGNSQEPPMTISQRVYKSGMVLPSKQASQHIMQDGRLFF